MTLYHLVCVFWFDGQEIQSVKQVSATGIMGAIKLAHQDNRVLRVLSAVASQ